MQVDVVGDEHQVAATMMWIHAAARVGDQHRLDAEGREDPHGKRHLLRRIAFVEMKPPLHGYD